MEYKLWITIDSRGLVELWDGNELPPYPKFTGVWKHQDAPAMVCFESYNDCPEFIQDYIDEHNIEWPNNEYAEPHKLTLTLKTGW